MAITPADIEQLTFSPSKHGYDTEEVDNFLEQLTVEVDSMLQKIAELKTRLNSTEGQLQSSQAKAASLQQQVSDLELELSSRPTVAPEPVAAPMPDYTASERQISQVLIVAQQSADRLVDEARSNADRIRNEADAKAREVIRQALAEKQNELDEIDRLKASREEFRTEYKNLLQHFIDDADAVFPNTTSAPKIEAPRYEAPAPAPAPVAAPVTLSDLSDFGDLD
jgi:cell division initiation protein